MITSTIELTDQELHYYIEAQKGQGNIRSSDNTLREIWEKLCKSLDISIAHCKPQTAYVKYIHSKFFSHLTTVPFLTSTSNDPLSICSLPDSSDIYIENSWLLEAVGSTIKVYDRHSKLFVEEQFIPLTSSQTSPSNIGKRNSIQSLFSVPKENSSSKSLEENREKEQEIMPTPYPKEVTDKLVRKISQSSSQNFLPPISVNSPKLKIMHVSKLKRSQSFGPTTSSLSSSTMEPQVRERSKSETVVKNINDIFVFNSRKKDMKEKSIYYPIKISTSLQIPSITSPLAKQLTQNTPDITIFQEEIFSHHQDDKVLIAQGSGFILKNLNQSSSMVKLEFPKEGDLAKKENENIICATWDTQWVVTASYVIHSKKKDTVEINKECFLRIWSKNLGECFQIIPSSHLINSIFLKDKIIYLVYSNESEEIENKKMDSEKITSKKELKKGIYQINLDIKKVTSMKELEKSL